MIVSLLSIWIGLATNIIGMKVGKVDREFRRHHVVAARHRDGLGRVARLHEARQRDAAHLFSILELGHAAILRQPGVRRVGWKCSA